MPAVRKREYRESFELLPNSSGNRLHIIKSDVTDLASASALCVLRLVFNYNGDQGSVTILNDADNCLRRPRLIQEHRATVSLPAQLFIAFSWGTILAVALFVIANTKSLSETFRVYAVLFTTLGWLATVSGMPRVGSLPIAPTIRRVYARTSRYRLAAVLLIGLGFVCSSYLAATVLRALAVRYIYTQQIRRAVTELPAPKLESLAGAFAPYRRVQKLQLFWSGSCFRCVHRQISLHSAPTLLSSAVTCA